MLFKTVKHLKANINDFHEKTPSWMFDRVIYTPQQQTLKPKTLF